MRTGRILAICQEAERDILKTRKLPEGICWDFAHAFVPELLQPDTLAVFILDEAQAEGFPFHQFDGSFPIFVHAVIPTLQDFPAGLPICRINAWPGFLDGQLLEIVVDQQYRGMVEAFLDTIGWQRQWVPDIVGMIRPRVLSMIINEAYFAVGESVSTPEDIDIAMTLGTNYPMGPLAWAHKIGPLRIFTLLDTLSKKDTRYNPAPQLLQSLQTIR